jgi:hypothetical protein
LSCAADFDHEGEQNANKPQRQINWSDNPILVGTTIVVDGVAIGCHCAINNSIIHHGALLSSISIRINVKKEREKQSKWVSPHVRGNQLQVGSNGNPIRPLVAKILDIYLLIGRGGLLLLVLVCVVCCDVCE